MTTLFWITGSIAWIAIGLLMLRFVWKDMHGGLAMIAHNTPAFGMLLFIGAIVFWPYPQGILQALVIWPMELWEVTQSFRYRFRNWLKTGKWVRSRKKEDPIRTNSDKIQEPRLTGDEVDAIMLGVEFYVQWAVNTPESDTNDYIVQRMTIAKRLASMVRDPQSAVREMADTDFSRAPKSWHRKHINTGYQNVSETSNRN